MTRLADRWIAAALFLYGLGVAVPLLLSSPPPSPNDPFADRLGPGSAANVARSVASVYYDDGFYYLGIARSIARGAGSTFDGQHPTNGYHPLWLGLLVVLARVSGTPEGLLLMSFVAQALAAAATAALVFLTARRFAGCLAASVGALVWVRLMHTYWMPWSGLEYGIQALAIATGLLCYKQVTADPSPSRGRLVTLGLLAAVVFLARIDNVLLAACLGIALHRHRGIRTPGLIAYGAPVTLAVVVYLTLNVWWFGNPLPVSGALKAIWSADLLAADPRYIEHGFLAAKVGNLMWPLGGSSRAFAAGIGLGSVGVVTILAIARRGPLRWLWPAAAFGLGQVLLYSTAYHDGYSFQPWYFVIQPMLAALLVAWLVHVGLAQASKAKPPYLPPLAMGLVLLLAATTMLTTARNIGHRVERQQHYGSEPLYAAAGWVRSHVPRDAVVGAWNAGTIGYLSGRQVINLDGLVNSWTFFRSDRLDLCAYAQREGIAYLVDAFQIEAPFQSVEPALDRCTRDLTQVWAGPEYPGSVPRRGALAFERRTRASVDSPF